MLIKLLNVDLADQVKGLFESELIHPVTLLYFYNNETCDSCSETGQLLEEITGLSDKLHLVSYDMKMEHVRAQKYRVTLAPGLVVAAGVADDLVDHGIRFAGMPSGYEFGSLIQAIILVSKQDSGLKPMVRSQLKNLHKPVHLQVFVTPT